MTETTIITTQICSDADDFDIRREFCGFQDKRLNDLRQFTSCIIDLQTHGTKHPFEKVTWMISHYDEAVRSFVVKRIQTWAQMTQLAAKMHADDIAFHQQISSDSSTCSMDAKIQLGNSEKSSPSPPKNSLFNEKSKTPSGNRRHHHHYHHHHHHSHVPNAALVPQTDVQLRNQSRRRRNSSSSSSGARRPALFGKPSDCFFSQTNEYPKISDSSLSKPITKSKISETMKLLDENGLSLIKQSNVQIEKEYAINADKSDDKETTVNDDKCDISDYEEDAKWANLLSDTSDFESDAHPLMADIILIAQLRDCLMNSQISSRDNIEYIKSLITTPLSISSHEQLKTLNSNYVWFYRLILNSKIIISNGVHESRRQAQILAYRKMIELMTNKQGVEPKIISGGRCKVVLRKAAPIKNLNETTTIDNSISVATESY